MHSSEAVVWILADSPACPIVVVLQTWAYQSPMRSDNGSVVWQFSHEGLWQCLELRHQSAGGSGCLILQLFWHWWLRVVNPQCFLIHCCLGQDDDLHLSFRSSFVEHPQAANLAGIVWEVHHTTNPFPQLTGSLENLLPGYYFSPLSGSHGQGPIYSPLPSA